MIKTVDQTTVADIFSINSDRVYRIPKYQREYTWGINDWDALFNDVTENDCGYFLGSYICVNSGSLNGTVLEVIDGQQRFSTLSLLLTALYEKLSALESQMELEDKTDLSNLRSELANKKQILSATGRKYDYTQRLILQKQNMNDEDFSYILSEKGVISAKKSRPLNFGNRRIAKAYRHFIKLIEDEVEKIKSENSNADDISALFSIKSKFEQAVLVGIEVDTNKDAYMLFESLNHRGVPLSALDLIKNTLIAQAATEAEADNSYELWKQILSNVGQDDYAVQERFFRQYYNAFREELNAPYKVPDKKYYLGYLATRTTLIDIYEKMIKSDYVTLLDDLLAKSQKYSLIVNNSDEEYAYTPALQDLERISGAPSYILMLYIMSNQAELELTDDHLNSIIKTLITFFVRRNVTDVPNTRKLTQLFIDVIAEAKLLQGDDIVNVIHDRLQAVAASDELFEEKLRGSIYDENPEATRFILCSIEARHQTKEIYSDLWARDNSNKYIWTIEHIFPEGENIPDSWVDMIAGGDKMLAKQYRSDYVHTLGNLTITGYNQNLSNMAFEQKRDRKSKDKTKDVGYRNGLYLNQDVVNEDTWTIKKITERTDALVKTLLEMYKW
ncbi:DUF262 domain-containing protein [Porcincola intestinalis]|uniref:DUF262 domain-containing protein n=1 Tax=Porcincola intestinalis TaxID=2606632 RepID=A0A6L5X7P6_9FIRM|nr:DUF262 domain-containing protein [Porcincola intestinalis]MSS15036.1 DUF262 domain-containing protein [Porcincola intestinalis]